MTSTYMEIVKSVLPMLMYENSTITCGFLYLRNNAKSISFWFHYMGVYTNYIASQRRVCQLSTITPGWDEINLILLSHKELLWPEAQIKLKKYLDTYGRVSGCFCLSKFCLFVYLLTKMKMILFGPELHFVKHIGFCIYILAKK